jgi:hypothetical protein
MYEVRMIVYLTPPPPRNAKIAFLRYRDRATGNKSDQKIVN